jgi:hypothetical protein
MSTPSATKRADNLKSPESLSFLKTQTQKKEKLGVQKKIEPIFRILKQIAEDKEKKLNSISVSDVLTDEQKHVATLMFPQISTPASGASFSSLENERTIIRTFVGTIIDNTNLWADNPPKLVDNLLKNLSKQIRSPGINSSDKNEMEKLTNELFRIRNNSNTADKYVSEIPNFVNAVVTGSFVINYIHDFVNLFAPDTLGREFLQNIDTALAKPSSTSDTEVIDLELSRSQEELSRLRQELNSLQQSHENHLNELVQSHENHLNELVQFHTVERENLQSQVSEALEENKLLKAEIEILEQSDDEEPISGDDIEDDHGINFEGKILRRDFMPNDLFQHRTFRLKKHKDPNPSGNYRTAQVEDGMFYYNWYDYSNRPSSRVPPLLRNSSTEEGEKLLHLLRHVDLQEFLPFLQEDTLFSTHYTKNDKIGQLPAIQFRFSNLSNEPTSLVVPSLLGSGEAPEQLKVQFELLKKTVIGSITISDITLENKQILFKLAKDMLKIYQYKKQTDALVEDGDDVTIDAKLQTALRLYWVMLSTTAGKLAATGARNVRNVLTQMKREMMEHYRIEVEDTFSYFSTQIDSKLQELENVAVHEFGVEDDFIEGYFFDTEDDNSNMFTLGTEDDDYQKAQFMRALFAYMMSAKAKQKSEFTSLSELVWNFHKGRRHMIRAVLNYRSGLTGAQTKYVAPDANLTFTAGAAGAAGALSLNDERINALAEMMRA